MGDTGHVGDLRRPARIRDYVLGLDEVGQTQVEVVGGKGALLGELARLEGICVPAGFCVTADAFARIAADASPVDALLEQLSCLQAGDRDRIRALSAEIRQTLERVVIPEEVAGAIRRALAPLGADTSCAVRSSATAEDSRSASFAGQHDTYLNVSGPTAVLEHVRRCWASLFSERAVTYRLRNGVEHRAVRMAVVVQKMVPAKAAGILFTADPLTSDRRVSAIEASFGPGEALVSGLVNPDAYKARDGQVVDRAIATEQPVLTDGQILRLVQLGRGIEAHFGRPHDIEWCLAGDVFEIVQSRPITTLFPPPPSDDGHIHVYVSVGHQQMMTDAMKPLGLSFWQMTTPRPMAEAGGRLFVDVTRHLAFEKSRAALMDLLGRSDPLMGDALRTVAERDGFIATFPDEAQAPAPPVDLTAPIEADAAIVAELIQRSRASIATLKREIRGKSGAPLLDFILEDIQELRRILFDPQSHRAIMAGMQASWWLNEQLDAWLGETNAADGLARSLSGNVTSEMGLALLDVADEIRPHADVVAFLESAADDAFLDELPSVAGGRHARAVLQAYLANYGMRCVGEIDITKPRWSERPTALLPALLGNIRNFEPGAAQRRHEQGQREARAMERKLLVRVGALPDGARKAAETKRMIELVRVFGGYREYPKYGMICRYFIYKQALLDEAQRLERAHVLSDKEDIFHLRFDELHDVVRAHRADEDLIHRRKDAYRSYEALTPPRVLTSDGEAIHGRYRRDDAPANALAGLPVSVGTIEGRARVVLDIAQADLEPGDILVTPYTDPSWTPLFLAVVGLVTEVGGLTTHGAVIAREYGLPAVVGVEQATRLIRDGQRIRVNGTDGYVEILSEPTECQAAPATTSSSGLRGGIACAGSSGASRMSRAGRPSNRSPIRSRSD